MQTGGAIIAVPAIGRVTRPNDQATALFFAEERDKDKAAAAARVNEKMKQGLEAIRREDPQATLTTRYYSTTPLYADNNQPRTGKEPVLGWRVIQYLDATTTNLKTLPKMVAAGQKVLGLASVRFGPSEPSARRADRQRIEAAYRSLSERIAATAAVMGRSSADVVLDSVDFDSSGYWELPIYVGGGGRPDESPQRIEEPSFESGVTTLQLKVIGKFKFK